MDHSHDVNVLNSLIATTVDSVDGYRTAAADSDSDRFRTIFNERANEREDLILDMQTRVRSLGGEPEDEGTALAGAHRVFLNLRNAVAGKDDTAVVSEVERGEDHIKSKFEAAIADDQLSQETREVVRECFASVRAGHDQMSSLKHGMEDQPTGAPRV